MELTAFNLARSYTLDAEVCVRYRHDGHVLLPKVATAEEVEYFRPLIVGLADLYARTRDVEVAPDEMQPLLEYLANVWRKNEEVREFVCAKRFARIAAELMGVKGIRLYHDEALIKGPGGSAAPWHKDHYNWPLETHSTIKMWLALVDIEIAMGSIRFASGSHHEGRFPEVPPSYESDELFSRIIRDHRIPVVSYSLKAGDACYYSGQVLHSTFPNTTRERREVLAVIYYVDGTRVMSPNHENRKADLEQYLPGLAPGDIAASPLNPMLYAV